MRAQRTALLCFMRGARLALADGAFAQKMFSRGPSPNVGRAMGQPAAAATFMAVAFSWCGRLGRSRTRDHRGGAARLPAETAISSMTAAPPDPASQPPRQRAARRQPMSAGSCPTRL